MREIKFGAWDKKENKMLIDYVPTFYYLEPVNLNEICGKKYAEAINIIEWNNKYARFDFQRTMNGLSGIGGHDLDIFLYRTGNSDGLMDYYLEWEVIGNIYENSELIK